MVIELCVIMLGWHSNALLKFRKHYFFLNLILILLNS